MIAADAPNGIRHRLDPDWHCVSDTACQFGRLRPLTQNRRFAIIPTVRGDGSRYPIGDIGHHSALFDETLRRSWRKPPPYMARTSALLDTTLRPTCIKVRRRVVKSTAESCLMYGGEAVGELFKRRYIVPTIFCGQSPDPFGVFGSTPLGAVGSTT